MSIRSMTGFAQVRGEVLRQNGAGPGMADASSPAHGRLAFALSLKSVNHRFLDLHFRLPSGTDSLEMQLRRLLKEKMARGHVEVTLSLERAAGDGFRPADPDREVLAGAPAARRRASRGSHAARPGEDR